VICNRQFRTLLSDVGDRIEPGMSFEDYARTVSRSAELDLPLDLSPEDWFTLRMDRHGRQHATMTVALTGDRWIQLSERRTLTGGAAILHTDVTDIVRQQRRAQEKVIDAQAQMVRATFDHLTQGLSTFDADGQLVSCNTRFRELLSLPITITRSGIGVDRIVAYLRHNRIFGEQPANSAILNWLDALIEQKPLRVEILRNDGVVLDASLQRLPDRAFIATFTDVTAERHVTAALQRANDTLEARVAERTEALTRANRDLMNEIRDRQAFESAMRDAKEAAEAANLSKTRFLAAASHDLLQPINAAKLFISTLQAAEQPDDQADITRHLARAFGSVEGLLHALLEISRLDAGRVEFTRTTVPISRVLDPLREEFRPLADRGEVRMRVMPSTLHVRTDPGYLRRIAQNLVSNALKHGRGARIVVGVRRRKGMAVLEVWDSGPGIAPRDRERIFDEFQRLSGSAGTEGMGLGLSIVRRACAQLGHALSLDSEPGRGTVFRVALETVSTPQQAPAALPDPAGLAPADDLDLIAVVVENDAEVLYATTKMLESWGISVLAVSSTEDAVQSIRDIDVMPDLIVADYHLDADDTGLKAIRAVRGCTRAGLPAIMVTADRTAGLRARAKDAGIVVLPKPVAPPQLRMTVSRLTEGE